MILKSFARKIRELQWLHPDWPAEKIETIVRAEQGAIFSEASSGEPVTVSGWYERGDGTIGNYYWANGRLHLSDVALDWAGVRDHKILARAWQFAEGRNLTAQDVARAKAEDEAWGDEQRRRLDHA